MKYTVDDRRIIFFFLKSHKYIILSRKQVLFLLYILTLPPFVMFCRLRILVLSVSTLQVLFLLYILTLPPFVMFCRLRILVLSVSTLPLRDVFFSFIYIIIIIISRLSNHGIGA